MGLFNRGGGTATVTATAAQVGLSGGPFTLTLPATTSLTRSGAGGYTYIYDNVSNSGNVTVSGGTLQFQSGTTLINASGATTTVTTGDPLIPSKTVTKQKTVTDPVTGETKTKTKTKVKPW